MFTGLAAGLLGLLDRRVQGCHQVDGLPRLLLLALGPAVAVPCLRSSPRSALPGRAHLGSTGRAALMDATEIRVRRASDHRGGRPGSSGKRRINAMKALVFTNERGRLLNHQSIDNKKEGNGSRRSWSALIHLGGRPPQVEQLRVQSSLLER